MFLLHINLTGNARTMTSRKAARALAKRDRDEQAAWTAGEWFILDPTGPRTLVPCVLSYGNEVLDSDGYVTLTLEVRDRTAPASHPLHVSVVTVDPRA